MTQLPLDLAAALPPAPARFDGSDYVARFDRERLSTQLEHIRDFMLARPGQWFTVQELGRSLIFPEPSISAQLRNLRKPRLGGWHVPKRRRGDPHRGCWEFTIREAKS
jgi:hypothetical protein